MTPAEIEALKPGDKIGYAFDRGWGGAKAVRESTVSRLTNTQIILANGMRFHRIGRRAGDEVGSYDRYSVTRLISLDSETAVKARVHDERQRLEDALEQLRKTKVELTADALLRHIIEMERVVKEASDRAVAMLNKTQRCDMCGAPGDYCAGSSHDTSAAVTA